VFGVAFHPRARSTQVRDFDADGDYGFIVVIESATVPKERMSQFLGLSGCRALQSEDKENRGKDGFS
jgi:hypothetical protein